jgi:hypothetical protein
MTLNHLFFIIYLLFFYKLFFLDIIDVEWIQSENHSLIDI